MGRGARRKTAHRQPGVSLCMIVKDEEQFLADCLESVRDVVDEINIVDTGSTDRTVAIAKSFGAKVIVRPWRDDFGWARNESLAMATGRWVLVLDADETITPESRRFLQSLRTEEPGDKALFVRIINDVEDEAGTATFSHFLPRIFPVSPRIRYGGAIHELLKLDDKLITGELSVVEILHRGYTSDTSKARAKSERNLPLLRRELAQHPDDPFALFNFGFCAVQQQPELIEEGIAALEQMMHVGTNEPFLTIGISALATTYARRKNNCARALLILELAEERLPPDSDIIFTHGTVLNMLGRFEEGRALWKRLIDAPDAYRHRPLVDDEIFKWKAPFNIALSYIAEGRYAESLVWIERAQEQKPNSTFIVTRTAAALEQAGAENEAERQYRRWAELEREKGTVELIKFLMRRQRPADAAEVIVKSPWLPPVETVECGIAVATAMIESRAGRPEDLLELVLRLEPANGEALFLYERVMTARTEAVRKAELAAECRSAADFFSPVESAPRVGSPRGGRCRSGACDRTRPRSQRGRIHPCPRDPQPRG